ncbi:hypothetical protein TRICI_005892 [Trichomonascus ciferrii]|uniref:Stress response protein NST1 n=1 Tax=Trichomonascus ciferrii TaxID=44093 RepID=A0A642UQP7_9ASCO|nr:hypothetical protein TRICI_005892 [Trichomonascus ciferrii]
MSKNKLTPEPAFQKPIAPGSKAIYSRDGTQVITVPRSERQDDEGEEDVDKIEFVAGDDIQFEYAHEGENAGGKKKKKKKKKQKQQQLAKQGDIHQEGDSITFNNIDFNTHSIVSAATTAASVFDGSSGKGKKDDKIWDTSSEEERHRIKQFWSGLSEQERRDLVRIEKDTVLQKMKEQQRHSCACQVCGRKRKALEQELEALYDAYYKDLEVYDEEDIPRDIFSFGSSLTIQGGILTVADDLLKNDGKKFIEMMERLAERRMARENETIANISEYDDEEEEDVNDERNDEEYYYYPDEEDEEEEEDDDDDEDDLEDDELDDDDLEDEDDEIDQASEEQRIREGRRMLQLFAARMFEQRVLTAYRQKVAEERQQKLLEELEEETRLKEEREAKKLKEKEKKKDKKRQQKLAKEKKEQERLQQEAALKAEQERQAEEARRKRQQQKEAERRAHEEERKRRQEEERKREAEKERKRREREEQEAKRRKEKEERKRQEELKREQERKRKEEEKRAREEEQERKKRVKELEEQQQQRKLKEQQQQQRQQQEELRRQQEEEEQKRHQQQQQQQMEQQQSHQREDSRSVSPAADSPTTANLLLAREKKVNGSHGRSKILLEQLNKPQSPPQNGTNHNPAPPPPPQQHFPPPHGPPPSNNMTPPLPAVPPHMMPHLGQNTTTTTAPPPPPPPQYQLPPQPSFTNQFSQMSLNQQPTASLTSSISPPMPANNGNSRRVSTPLVEHASPLWGNFNTSPSPSSYASSTNTSSTIPLQSYKLFGGVNNLWSPNGGTTTPGNGSIWGSSSTTTNPASLTTTDLRHAAIKAYKQYFGSSWINNNYIPAQVLFHSTNQMLGNMADQSQFNSACEFGVTDINGHLFEALPDNNGPVTHVRYKNVL